MGDHLIGNLVLVWLAVFLAVLALAWGLTRWFKWRHSMLQRLLD
jgi:hypothetical protein